MPLQPLACALLALILSVSLFVQPVILKPARAAAPNLVVAQTSSTIRRVVPGGSVDPACGGSWNPASPTPALRACDLQTALSVSLPGDEVWVMRGVYLPTQRSDPADPRSAAFRLTSGAKVYGGFAGTETALDQRAWTLNQTVLSGDLDGNDLQRPALTWTDIQGANAYHVVDASGAALGTLLDGFTISGGYANGVYVGPCAGACGGGLYGENASVGLTHLKVMGNNTDLNGGGMMITGSGSTWLEDVSFSGNHALFGGGMMALSQTQVGIYGASFFNNEASSYGGGLFLENSKSILRDVQFDQNVCDHGGGLAVTAGTARLDRVSFAENHPAIASSGRGGGMYVEQRALVTVTNTTFAYNQSRYGTALFSAANSKLYLTHVTMKENGVLPTQDSLIDVRDAEAFELRDSILYQNHADTMTFASPRSRPLISNTIYPSACPGNATCTDLRNIDPILADLHPVGLTWGFPLRRMSPAVDLASCTDWVSTDGQTVHAIPLEDDQSGAVRLNGGACDLGALELGAQTIYVDDSASGRNTGASWADANTDLQDALRQAIPGDEIWVAAGTYYPTADPGGRAYSFALRPDVEIYGGFAGTETSRDQRNWTANETVLSGDIDHGQPTPTGNSYHVLFSDSYSEGTEGISQSSILDGFRITGGQADGPYENDRRGGGVYLFGSQPILRNLVIDHNTADQGGGMYNNGYAQLINVLIRDNQAVYGGGLANGAGPSSSDQGAAVLTNVTFTNNTADYGGAIANRSVIAYPPYYGRANLVHVTILGNTARLHGGAIYAAASDEMVGNSILWNNGPEPLYAADADSGFTLRNTILQGGCPAGAACTSVSATDPLLGALGSGAGGPLTFPPLPNSPAIDAGLAGDCTLIIPTGTFTNDILPLPYDQRGAPRPAGGACDLGAHEVQAELAILSGDNQVVEAGEPFPLPLVVGASSAWGDSVEGVAIHYTLHLTDAGGSISSPTATVTNGQAAVTATAGLGGGFAVSATAPGYNTVTFHLSVKNTRVRVSASPNPAALGQPVTLTATITGTLPGIPPTPGGTVTFKDGATVLGSVTLPVDPFKGPTAQAALVASNLATGTHSVTAVYSGDTAYSSNTSPVYTLTVSSGGMVGLSGLARSYTGKAQAVTVTTNPPGLPVRVTYDGSTTPPTNAGSYAVYAEITDPNYTGSASGTLVIDKAPLEVFLGSDSRLFGAPNPPVGTTITGFVNGETEAVITGNFALTCAATLDSPVGSYPIVAALGTLQAANYRFTFTPGTLTVEPAPTTTQVTVNPGSPVYNQVFNLAATVAREQPGGPYPTGWVVFYVGSLGPVRAALSNGQAIASYSYPAGTYPYTARYEPDGNHLGGYTEGTFTVQKASVKLTLSGLDTLYSGTAKTVTVTTEPAGVPVTVTYNGSVTPPVRAGSYTVVAQANSANYTGSATGTLAIATVPLTVTAADATRPYGGPNPTPGYTITGFVNGETSSVITGVPVITVTATASSPVDDYLITAAPGTLKADNYHFTFVPGTLTVTKAATTTTLTVPTGLVYGQTVTLTTTIAGPYAGGPVPGGSVTFTVDGAPDHTIPLADGAASYLITGMRAGNYSVTATYLPDGNHTASSASKPLVISKAQATVTLSGLNMVYNGQPQPVTVTTDPPGLPVTVTYGPQSTPPTNVGEYSVSAQVTDDNYIGSANSTLAIAKAPLTVTVEDVSRPYGVPNPAVRYAITGFVSGEDEDAISGTPVLGDPPAVDSLPGHYAISIQAGTLQAANYSFTLVPGTFTVARLATLINLTTVPNPVPPGRPVTLTATVTPVGSALTGEVVISIEGHSPVTVPLGAEGRATYILGPLPPGTYRVTVQYNGNVIYDGSVSRPISVVVERFKMFLPIIKN